MIERGIRDFVSRDWEAARNAKDEYWGERVARLGPIESFRISEELRQQALLQVPSGRTQRIGSRISALTCISPRYFVSVQPAALELLADLSRVLEGWERWYVFGAQAVIAYGVPRLSADVDVTVKFAPDDPEHFAADMREAGSRSESMTPTSSAERGSCLSSIL